MNIKHHAQNLKPIMTRVLLVILFSVISNVQAKSKVVAIEEARYEVSLSLEENLEIFQGKKVQIYLKSGANVSGIVKAVGKHLLHLEKLERREYYDAIIRMEDINGFDSRFRKNQR